MRAFNILRRRSRFETAAASLAAERVSALSGRPYRTLSVIRSGRHDFEVTVVPDEWPRPDAGSEIRVWAERYRDDWVLRDDFFAIKYRPDVDAWIRGLVPLIFDGPFAFFVRPVPGPVDLDSDSDFDGYLRAASVGVCFGLGVADSREAGSRVRALAEAVSRRASGFRFDVVTFAEGDDLPPSDWDLGDRVATGLFSRRFECVGDDDGVRVSVTAGEVPFDDLKIGRCSSCR